MEFAKEGDSHILMGIHDGSGFTENRICLCTL